MVTEASSDTSRNYRLVAAFDHARTVEVNDRVSGNAIHTYKYNMFSFLPLNILEQFCRPANIFFLAMAIMTSFPALSPVGPASSIAPLVFVLAVTAIKDGIEDYARHKLDHEVNNRLVKVYRPNQDPPKGGSLDAVRGWMFIPWSEVKVGDILWVNRDQKIPSDMFLLSVSPESKGIAFVDTQDLDGETNLKRKNAFRLTRALDPSNEDMFRWFIKCETPNKFLHRFDSVVFRQDPLIHGEKDSESITVSNLLLRECTLRNTEWAIGVAIYTGYDTKIAMQNSGNKTRRKVSKIDSSMNFLVLGVFSLLMSISLICTLIGDHLGRTYNQQMWYISFWEQSPGRSALLFGTFVIVFNFLLPISLYVSLEIVRIFHALFIQWDKDMYYAEIDVPARTNNSNLCDELGQIEYIFSDKTGTLTRNQMDFMKASIGGIAYGDGPINPQNGQPDWSHLTEIGKAKLRRLNLPVPPDPPFPSVYPKIKGFNFRDDRLAYENAPSTMEIRLYMLAIALCNEVLVERDPVNPEETLFKSASPDEVSIVSAAQAFGYTLKATGDEGKLLQELNRPPALYRVLASFEFNSDRKRQSVVVQMPDTGELIMFVKGADNKILERLTRDGSGYSRFEEETKVHLDMFSEDGLRTLAVGYKVIDPNEWAQVFGPRLQNIQNLLEGRDVAMASLAEDLERGFHLLGATAIEDKLQDGVPECIATLQRANLKIWILTGDKWGTAINIGYACSLLTNQMKQAEIQGLEQNDPKLVGRSTDEQNRIMQEHVGQLLDFWLRQAQDWVKASQSYSVIVDGDSLLYALEPPLRSKFRMLGMMSTAVVCCRVSPDQKAQVVGIVNDIRSDEEISLVETVEPSSKQNSSVFSSTSGNTNIAGGFLTLGIGDGANDVKMIKEANVGVGIMGVEGTQAVLNSDFAFGQFRYLARLLLVHGRLNYIRVTRFLLYFFYKNMTYALTQLWFSIYTQFSGSVFVEAWYSSMFNVIFTSIPILVFAIFERDVSDETVLRKVPILYKRGQVNGYLRWYQVLLWAGEAIYSSIIYFFLPVALFGALPQQRLDGLMFNSWSVSTVSFTCVVIGVNLRLALLIRWWTWLHHLFLWLSILAWFLFAMVFNVFPIPFLSSLRSAGIYWTIYDLFSTPVYWLVVIVTLVVGLGPAYISMYVRRWILIPPRWAVFQEREQIPELHQRDLSEGFDTELLPQKPPKSRLSSPSTGAGLDLMARSHSNIASAGPRSSSTVERNPSVLAPRNSPGVGNANRGQPSSQQMATSSQHVHVSPGNHR